MNKAKIVSTIVFASILTGLIIVGAIYASGSAGKILIGGMLTPEGSLGAGLLASIFPIWIWVLAVNLKYLMAKNKSLLLNLVLVTLFFIPPLSIVISIYYLCTNQIEKEKIEFKKAKEVENA